jgi:hypothetical protein
MLQTLQGILSFVLSFPETCFDLSISFTYSDLQAVAISRSPAVVEQKPVLKTEPPSVITVTSKTTPEVAAPKTAPIQPMDTSSAVIPIVDITTARSSSQPTSGTSAQLTRRSSYQQVPARPRDPHMR